MDDVHGYDFISQSGDLIDNSGHGTHIAGIIAADHDSGQVTGVAPKSKLLIYDFFGSNEDGTVFDAIRGIRAAAQLLIDIPLEKSKREALLCTIRDGADVTLSMTEDLLDVAAIREGKVELMPDAIDLSNLVEGRAELFRMTAQAKDIKLSLDLSRIPPVWADAKRAAQALDNLVGNAVKYSPHNGEVTIELRAFDGRARLAVIDQGQGIPPDELGDIFQPFERASPRPNGGERSVGLGLAIVKRLVEAQNGEIKVESAPGKGSRFEMFLPFATVVGHIPARNRTDPPSVFSRV